MDAAERLPCLVGQPVDLISFGHIGRHRKDLGPRRPQRTLGPAQRFHLDIREDNFHAFRSESFGHRQADTARSPRDDRDPAFQRFHYIPSR